MSESKSSTTSKIGHPQTPGRFTQPLAIVGICLSFIGFSLAAGLVNLGRLDAALTRLAASRAEAVISNIAADAGARYARIKAAESGFGGGTGLTDSGGAYEFRSGLLSELTDLTSRMAAGTLRPKEAVGWSASGAALLDANGGVLEQAGDLPPEVIEEAGPVARGESGISIHLFDRLLNQDRPGFLAQARDGGAAVAAVSPEWFLRRAREYALATAVENSGETDAAWLPASDSPLGKNGAVRRVRVDGRPVLEVVAPVSMEGVSAGRIRVGLPADETARLLADIRRQIWIATGFLAGLAVLAVGFLIVNQRRHDTRIRRMERRVQGAARLSALGRLAGGVAHEIRNPLNAISIAAQRLARKYPDPMMGVVREEIRRLNDILEEFLTVARRRELSLRPGDLCAPAEDVAALMAEAAANGDVSIEKTWSLNPCPTVLDPDRMKQAILNVVKNALEATPPGGTVRLATRERGRNRVALMVSDTGAGIEPAHADRVFDLDFTTKERGVGLGLPLAHEIIRGHGGELRLVETSSKGTIFEIVLPRVKKGGETNAHSHR